MKINQPHETSDVELQSRLRRAETTPAAKTSHALPPTANDTAYAPAKDEIRVSPRAAQLGKLTERVLQAPDVRAERVEQLRAQVQSGSYNPPAAAIADAMLKDGR
jgi:flagellar biosynthesis anti-sigma factor FlgM